jgi:hypothetical protein
MSARVILYHKQAISARTLFLSMEQSVCLFGGLPKLSQASGRGNAAQLLAETERALGLGTGSLELESEFHATLDTPGQEMPVFLARFTSIDPPRDQVAARALSPSPRRAAIRRRNWNYCARPMR